MEEYSYLAHHGIKGMRWGVRRFRNEDGSLTRAGKIRYAQASSANYGSGHIKQQHRAAMEQISKIRDPRIQKLATIREERKYKQALKNQERTDKLKDAHEKRLEQIDKSTKPEFVKSVLKNNENLNYEDAVRRQEEINNGKAAIKKALLIAGGVAVAGAVVYAVHKSDQSITANIADKINTPWQDLMRDGGRKYAEALSHNFSSVSDAHSYHSSNNFSFTDWATLSHAERKGVKSYTGNSYLSMNKLLRSGSFDSSIDSELGSLINGCTSALSKSHVAEDCIVHRGIGSSLPKAIGISAADIQLNPEALIGHSFVDRGFTSAGVSASDAWGGCKMHIFVPAGSQGMYVDPISAHPGEHELLLQRGSEYVIRSYKQSDNGFITDIFVDLVGQLVDD